MSDLSAALIEIEAHVAASGWDQSPRLFALADSTDLATREPALAAQLGLGQPHSGLGLTSVEQEGVPADRPLDELLGGIVWPDTVVGAVVVVERIVLPPEAEEELAAAEGDAVRYAAEHSGRTDVRLVGGVLRDGSRQAVLRVRGHDAPSDLMTGPEIAPGLLEALARTFEE